jgi:hypothetical protein
MLRGEITSQSYTAIIRANRQNAVGVVRNILNTAVGSGHAQLALSAIESMKKTRPEWNFPRIEQRALGVLRS